MLRYALILIILAGCTAEKRDLASKRSCSQMISFLLRGGLLEKASFDPTFLKLADQFDEILLARLRGEADSTKLVAANNALIESFERHLIDARIEVKEIETVIRFQHETFTIKQLELDASRSETDGLRLLGYLQEKMGVKKIRFDLLETRLNGDAGFLRGLDSLLVMNLNEYLQFMESDRLSLLAYHELGHARFDLLRRAGKRSAYSNDYLAGKSGGMGGRYSDYFSAEELYNFSADPYRGLENFSRYDSSPLLFIHNYKIKMQELNEVAAVGSQGELLSQAFIKQIDDYVGKGTLLGERFFQINDQMIFLEDSMGRILRSYIDDEKRVLIERYHSLKREVESLLSVSNLKKIFDRELKKRGHFFWSRMANKSQANQLRDRSLELLDLQREILAELKKEQSVLSTVSKGIVAGSADLKEVMNRFLVAEFREEVGLEEIYKGVRREARIFANRARENYRDFYAIGESLIDPELGNY